MKNVYEVCPVFENERFILRPVVREDAADLLRVYSDEKAVPFFNSDNCNGDDFHYTTLDRMTQAMDFWQDSYDHGWFVRWSIQDKFVSTVMGTIEMCLRESEDFYDGCGILRVDLHSDYEAEESIQEILALIVPPAFDLFGCNRIITKAIPDAVKRRCSLRGCGFLPCSEPLVGHDGTEYYDYFVFEKAWHLCYNA